MQKNVHLNYHFSSKTLQGKWSAPILSLADLINILVGKEELHLLMVMAQCWDRPVALPPFILHYCITMQLYWHTHAPKIHHKDSSCIVCIYMRCIRMHCIHLWYTLLVLRCNGVCSSRCWLMSLYKLCRWIYGAHTSAVKYVVCVCVCVCMCLCVV